MGPLDLIIDEAAGRSDGDPEAPPEERVWDRVYVWARGVEAERDRLRAERDELRQRAEEYRHTLVELRCRLHAAGRRPEECHEMSVIDAALGGETPE